MLKIVQLQFAKVFSHQMSAPLGARFVAESRLDQMQPDGAKLKSMKLLSVMKLGKSLSVSPRKNKLSAQTSERDFIL